MSIIYSPLAKKGIFESLYAMDTGLSRGENEPLNGVQDILKEASPLEKLKMSSYKESKRSYL